MSTKVVSGNRSKYLLVAFSRAEILHRITSATEIRQHPSKIQKKGFMCGAGLAPRGAFRFRATQITACVPPNKDCAPLSKQRLCPKERNRLGASESAVRGLRLPNYWLSLQNS